MLELEVYCTGWGWVGGWGLVIFGFYVNFVEGLTNFLAILIMQSPQGLRRFLSFVSSRETMFGELYYYYYYYYYLLLLRFSCLFIDLDVCGKKIVFIAFILMFEFLSVASSSNVQQMKVFWLSLSFFFFAKYIILTQ